ncbi:acylphosphatase [Nakamurella sp. A5-74]|uniref:acylphosphatase n=1 Tax=Nakamurella sp. A5-74 TaxID=3158264 RepID=A0AAU8DUR3_9ACTN
MTDGARTDPLSGDAETLVRMTVFVRGRVQGVGFRWWTRSRALELGLVGSATNRADGGVEVVAEGPRADCAQLLVLLRGPDAPGLVESAIEQFAAPRGVGPEFVER